MGLTTPQAIIGAAIILALAGLFLFRYEVSPGIGVAAVLRLNRLTGDISVCQINSTTNKHECQ